MIFFSNIIIKYDKKTVINDLSYNVKKGSFTTIMGRNGCGKSTLIKTLTASKFQTSGKILVYDLEVNKKNKSLLSKKLSFLLQFNDSLDNITVFEYISYGRLPHKSIFSKLTYQDHEIIKQVIKKTALLGYEKRLLSSLSGGERQRVYLAMCLAQEPEVLILDEPTTYLDIKFQFELLSLIKEINKTSNMTVLCILHDLNQAIKYSDQLIFLQNGKIKASGSAKNIITTELIYDIFGVNSKIYIEKNEMHVDYLI